MCIRDSCEVALVATVDGVQRDATEVMVEAAVCGCVALDLSPQEVRAGRTRQVTRAGSRVFNAASPRAGCGPVRCRLSGSGAYAVRVGGNDEHSACLLYTSRDRAGRPR